MKYVSHSRMKKRAQLWVLTNKQVIKNPLIIPLTPLMIQIKSRRISMILQFYPSSTVFSKVSTVRFSPMVKLDQVRPIRCSVQTQMTRKKKVLSQEWSAESLQRSKVPLKKSNSLSKFPWSKFTTRRSEICLILRKITLRFTKIKTKVFMLRI